MTPLHAHAQYVCIVYAKYVKASVKALVQVEFPMYALSKQKQHKQTGKMAKFTKLRSKVLKNGQVPNAVILSKSIFMASNFFMQMFNVSTLCMQSIRWLR